jgi:putative acetyltransferase
MMQLRPARPEDQEAIMALIDSVYGEYGDRLCPERGDHDLLDIDGHYVRAGGAFIVLDEMGHIRGTHATLPDAARPCVCILRRLYLEAALRGGPWGARLMQWAVDWAGAHGMRRLEFWSDTRFTRAHAFFARFGFQRDGRRRVMHDGWMPYEEYFFSRDLSAQAVEE